MATLDPGGSWGVVLDPYKPPELGPEFTLPRCGCVTYGNGPPNNSTGNNGDVYIDDLTEIIYQRQNNVYVVIGSVGGTDLYQGHYAAGIPSFTPDHFPVIAADLDAPFQWWLWNGTAWQ